ncbi:MAG TPA: isoprenylcysteine carboxylmethyltransferase family protein [Pirellulales bacterium]|nr:isoprenylcysteine carboxylmethyltransferase family protein [Pirellulales bacterium]
MDQSVPTTSFVPMADFLVKQRVTISLVVFSTLVAKDILLGTKPHDTGNLGDPYAMAGMVLVLWGLAVRSWAAGVIRKSKVLATTGPYRLCRHPLYLGSLAMMLGFCTIVGSMLDLCVVLGPVLAIYLLTIRREERRLAERHGEAWRQYTDLAPRLLPTRGITNLQTDWSLDQWMTNREYNALVTSLAALTVLHFWQRF